MDLVVIAEVLANVLFPWFRLIPCPSPRREGRRGEGRFTFIYLFVFTSNLDGNNINVSPGLSFL